MRKSTLKLVVKLTTVFAVVLFVFLITLLTFQYIKLNNLENTENALQIELDNLIEVRENYEAEYDYIQNYYSSYVEDYVREVLGWGRDGEIKFQSE